MRYLFFFTAGLTGACALSGYLTGSCPMGAVIALFLCVVCWIVGRKYGKKPIAAVIFAGVAVGFLWYSIYDGLYLAPARAYAGRTETCQAVLTRYPRDAGEKQSAVAALYLEGKPYEAMVYLESGEELQPGDRILGTFRLQLAARTEGGSHSQQGVFFRAFQQGNIQVIRPERPPIWTIPAFLRCSAERNLRRFLPEDAAPFGEALLLGNSKGLTYDQRWELERSGIRHVVAVSGLHVTILCALLGKFTGKRKYLTFLLGLPMLLLFALAIGFTPSVVRASLMMGLYLASRVVRRQYDPLTELSAAVLIMVFLNPLTVLEPGFQLSCASVLGIFTFYSRLFEPLKEKIPWENRLRQWILRFLSASLCMSASSLIFVLPLCALYFGSVSLIAPLTNLLTVWLMPFLFWGLLLTLGLGAVLPWLGSVLGSLCGLGIRWVLWVAGGLSRVPMAAVYTHSSFAWVCILVIYCLLGFCFLGKKKRWRLFASAAAASFLLTIALARLLPALPAASVTALDVGQGQCILLETHGKTFLVDCGGDRDEYAGDLAAKTLLSRGITRLDGLILTHFDRDHVGGVPYLLKHIGADRIYLPAHPMAAGRAGVIQVSTRQDLSLSGERLTIYPGADGAEGNEMSLAVLLDTEVYDILITGDRSREGELDLLSHYALPRVNCLVAGHHGAADSTSRELLNATRPETVLISAGQYNFYGHPAEETLLRLTSFGCRILRTDQLGSITIWR